MKTLLLLLTAAALTGCRSITQADYRIAWISPDYNQVVVAREKRDDLWILARSPEIPDADYARLSEFAVSLGYEASQIKGSPQEHESARRH